MNETKIEYLDGDEAAQEAYNAALDQLADPAGIAARALQRAQEADELHGRIDGADPLQLARLNGQQRSALGVAAILAQVAELAIHLQQHGVNAHPRRMLDLGDEEDATTDTAPPALGREAPPVALRCRFTADLPGEQMHVSGVPMAFVDGYGWFNIDAATLYPGGIWRFTGRALSRYRDQVLVVPDGGEAVMLPAVLVTLEADE